MNEEIEMKKMKENIEESRKRIMKVVQVTSTLMSAISEVSRQHELELALATGTTMAQIALLTSDISMVCSPTPTWIQAMAKAFVEVYGEKEVKDDIELPKTL